MTASTSTSDVVDRKVVCGDPACWFWPRRGMARTGPSRTTATTPHRTSRAVRIIGLAPGSQFYSNFVGAEGHEGNEGHEERGESALKSVLHALHVLHVLHVFFASRS